MTVPVTFRNNSERITVNYSYSEVASNTGMVEYNLLNEEDSVGKDYIISRDSLRSKDIEYSNASTSTQTTDHDYDLTIFQSNTTIRGTALITGSFGGNMGVGTTADAKIKVYVRKWDGSTETEIGNNTTHTLSCLAAVKTQTSFTLAIDLTETKFKKGDNLRITIEASLTITAGSNSSELFYGHDPVNRDGTYLIPSSDTTTTQLKAYIPYKLQA